MGDSTVVGPDVTTGSNSYGIDVRADDSSFEFGNLTIEGSGALTATGAWSKAAGRWLSKASSLKAAAGKAKGTVRVSWAADAQATGGYKAYACAKKDGKVLARKAVAAGRTSATLAGLASGKAYYVKVRPVRKASGTTCVGVQRYCKETAKAR